MSKKPPLQNQRFKWWEHVTGYKIEREGIVVLSDGKRVISSNDSSMLGEMVAEDPYIKAFDSHPKSDALVRMAENGKIYYGKSAKCDPYYIFRYEKYRLAYSTIM